MVACCVQKQQQQQQKTCYYHGTRFFKKLIQERGLIKWSKVTVKIFIMLQKKKKKSDGKSWKRCIMDSVKTV